MEKRNIDLDNLTRNDFEEIARYCHSLELRLEECKANAIAIVTQRNNAYQQIEQLKGQLAIYTLPKQPTIIKLDDNIDLVNPEQYKIKKQF